MATHTPGPWGYEVTCDGSDFEIAPAVDLLECNWSREVAITASGNEFDARLIAAAPDLLAALKRMINLTNDDFDDEQCAAWDAAEAAIAKAEDR